MTDENPYDSINIRQFKLTTGENVLGLIVGLDKDTSFIKMERPVTLISESINGNKQRFYFADWMPVSKSDTVLIAPNHVVSQSEVDSRIKESYVKYCINFGRDLYEGKEVEDDYEDDIDYGSIGGGSSSIH